MNKLFRLVAILAVVAVPASAQTPDPDILRTVTRFFDAMRAKDTAALRALVDSSTRLVSTGMTREGEPRMRAVSIQGFLQSIPGVTDVPDERIFEPEVRQDANLATVWTRYSFYVGSQFSHCGYDSFHLFRSESGWKIFAIADTRRREGCMP